MSIEIVGTRSAYYVNSKWFLSGTNKIGLVLRGRYEVEVTQFTDGTSDLVIKGSFGNLSTVKMYERDTENGGCQRGGKRLVPVPHKQKRVRP
jgi:hypothetical protein